MPEPDPLTDALAKFTPVAGFDRDALLFEAGRRKARPSRRWPALAGLLAVSQVVTLVALWPRTPDVVPMPGPVEPPVPEFVIPPSAPLSEMWTAGSSPDVLAAPPRPVDGEFISTGPPLTVRSTIPID
jgi:hypothetical protein